MTTRVSGPDPFEELGLADDAGPEAVRDARRRLAKRHHPDAGGDPVRMQAVNAAAAAALRRIADRTGPPPDAGPAGGNGGAADRMSDASGSRAGSAESPPTGRCDSGSSAFEMADADGHRVAGDVPSFTVEALPVETFEALLTAVDQLGTVLDDDPPYRLDVFLSGPPACWCRLEIVPDAGASTVSLLVGSIDGGALPSTEAVRDKWIDALNGLDWS